MSDRGIDQNPQQPKPTIARPEMSGHAGDQLEWEPARVDRVSQIITSTLDIESVYEEFSRELRALISFDRLAINVIDYPGECFIFRYLFGETGAHRKPGDSLPLSGTQIQYVIETGITLICPDVSATADEFAGDRRLLESGMRSSVIVPLISENVVIGTINLRSRNIGI